MTMFVSGTAFACNGGGGGGTIDSDTGAASGANVQDTSLAAFEEASLFDQYNEGQDRMDNEFIRDRNYVYYLNVNLHDLYTNHNA